MSAFVVVEGPRDAQILRWLLTSAQIGDVQLVAGGSKSSATSLARSISVARHVPVAAVVDADTSDSDSVIEQELIFDDFVRALPITAPCRLFLAIPTLEEALFPDTSSVEAVFGVRFSAEEKARFSIDKKRFLGDYLRTVSLNEAGHRLGRRGQPGAKSGFGNPLLKSLFAFLKSQRLAVATA
jgi:hypothetical protein